MSTTSKEKTLDNLEVGDVITFGCGGRKWVVTSIVDDNILVVNTVTEGGAVIRYTRGYLKTERWRIEQPLDGTLLRAKAMLEAIGFKVTR